MHVNNLLPDESCRAEYDILSLTPHVFEVFDGGEVMPDLPNDVGEENCERNCARNPDPLLREFAAMVGEEQSQNDREPEGERGRFIFEAQASQNSEPQPEKRVSRAQNARQDKYAPHPGQ